MGDERSHLGGLLASVGDEGSHLGVSPPQSVVMKGHLGEGLLLPSGISAQQKCLQGFMRPFLAQNSGVEFGQISQ